MNTNLGAAAEFAEADLDHDAIQVRANRLSGGLSLRPACGAEGLLHGGRFCARQRHQGRLHAFRSLLRRPPPRGLPHLHPRPRRHRFRQREGASVAVSGRVLRGGLRGDPRPNAIWPPSPAARRAPLFWRASARSTVPAVPITEARGRHGAGDLYAAGFMFGLATGRDLETCARLGSLAASEVITHVGPRPQRPLSGVARTHGLL